MTALCVGRYHRCRQTVGTPRGAGRSLDRARPGTRQFLAENAGDWLDGVDNSEFFTSFTITSVTVSGKSGTVSTTEEWPDGPTPRVYGVVEQGGNVLVGAWTVPWPPPAAAGQRSPAPHPGRRRSRDAYR